MRQTQFFNDFISQNHNSSISNLEIVSELITGHELFKNKMIPEIEQHFLVLLSQADIYTLSSLTKCFKKFDVFRLNLMDHIEMEEKIVFPYLLGNGTYNSKETVEFFIEHHEDYETQLQQMIEEINAQLTHLSCLFPFRLLILKLNSFSLKLEDHGELEDVLFVI
jgi:iron-sulfur cluster repair protein YtfE (RIC family)